MHEVVVIDKKAVRTEAAIKTRLVLFGIDGQVGVVQSARDKWRVQWADGGTSSDYDTINDLVLNLNSLGLKIYEI